MLSVPAWLRWWLFGAVIGIALLWLMIFDWVVFPLALVVLVVLVVRSPERAAHRSCRRRLLGLIVEFVARTSQSGRGSC